MSTHHGPSVWQQGSWPERSANTFLQAFFILTARFARDASLMKALSTKV
jgi:hypothetical protein